MTDNIIDINEVCRITGLARRTVYILRYKGEIPYFHFGPRLLRFRRQEIIDWMANRQYTPLKDVVARKKALRRRVQEEALNMMAESNDGVGSQPGIDFTPRQ